MRNRVACWCVCILISQFTSAGEVGGVTDLVAHEHDTDEEAENGAFWIFNVPRSISLV